FLVYVALILRAHSTMQAQTASPYLRIEPSARAIGMGGTSAAVYGDDPFAPLDNAGQLGLLSLDHYLIVGATSPVSLLPAAVYFGNNTYSSTVVDIGYPLSNAFHIPFPLSVGFGYCRASLRVDSLIQLDSWPYVVIEEAEEYSDSYLFG